MRDDTVTGTCVIGIHTAGNAETERVSHGCAGKAADACHRGEGVAEDQAECARNLIDVEDQDADTCQNVSESHERNGLFHNGSDTLQTAGDGDEAGDAHDDDGDLRVNAERLVHAAGQGLGLHAAGPGTEHEAEDGKDQRAGLPAEGVLHDEGTVAEVLVLGLVELDAVTLAEDDLAGLGAHAQKAGDPHPEDCARTAHGDRGGDAADVADADGVGHRGTCSRETGDRAFALAALEHLAVGVLEMELDLRLISALKKDRQEDARADDCDDARRTPENI